MPTWVIALQLAEEWGVPPWVIMEHPGSLMWSARHAFYKKQERVVQEWIRESKK